MKLDGIFFKLKKKIYVVVSLIGILLFFAFQPKHNDQDEYEQMLSQENELQEVEIGEDYEDLEVSTTPKEKYELILNQYKNQIQKKEIEYTSKSHINFYYSPVQLEVFLFQSQVVSNISDILFSEVFKEKNLILDLEFFHSFSKVRGRFQHNTIKFFGVRSLSNQELVAVFLHELGHYFDINYLQKQVFFDVSNEFYDISWSDTKTLYRGSEKRDFVSGYAMTNKYEDFAESFLYYILYNDDFRAQASQSKKLLKKYDFFSQYIFKNDEFKKTNFRIESQLSDTYRDITKIKFSLKNFLEYLKTGV